MTPRVVLRREVPDDLRSVIQFLATHSPDAADRFAQSVEASVAQVAAMPGMGSPKHFRDRRLAGMRSWSVADFPDYLILYKPIDDGIKVFAVVHGARRLSSILRSRV